MSLAKNIQFLREKHGLTQEDLSEYLCVSRQSISKWETGAAFPDTEKIIALCDKFDISMDLLVRGDLTANDGDCDFPIKENFVKDETLNKQNESTEDIFDEDFSKQKNVVDDNLKYDENVSNNGQSDENNSKFARMEKISQSVCGLIMVISVAVFIIVGLLTNIWHPTWIACVCGAMTCAVICIIFDLKKHKKDYHKIMGDCCGILMCLTALAYVVLNTFIGKWHPSWIMFIISAFICAILGIIGDLIDKKTE